MRDSIIDDLHLSKANVTEAIKSLIRSGILTETVAPNNRKGRHPKTLSINGNQCFSIGIAVYFDYAEIVVVDAAQKVLAVNKVENLERDGKKQLARLLRGAKQALHNNKLDTKNLAGTGITIPGIIDHKQGIVRKSVFFNDPDGTAPIIPFWEKAFNRPCRLMERSAALAFNEHVRGSAVNMSDFLYLDGMGLGMFLNGQVYMGHQNYGGEIGFMKISDTNVYEGDGRTGTFARINALNWMAQRIKEAVANGGVTMLSDYLKSGRKISQQLVVETALKGDVLCRRIIEDGFGSLADMAVNLNYLFNPEAIFLWPWTTKCPEISIDIVRRKVDVCRAINPDMTVKVLPALCGEDSLAHGIAMLSLDDFFTKNA